MAIRMMVGAEHANDPDVEVVRNYFGHEENPALLKMANRLLAETLSGASREVRHQLRSLEQ